MVILGVSAYYHDSAASLIKDGKVVAACEEERFSRAKHDNNFPFRAIESCLKESGLSIGEVDYVAYYEKPLLKLERAIENYVETFPRSWLSFVRDFPPFLMNKTDVERVLRKDLGYQGKVLYVPHHLSHAWSAYVNSGFKRAAVLTIDGVGEYTTTALWHVREGKIKLLKSVEYPHSIGLLYSTFTAFLGFQVNNDEYKMMGLAAYGRPRYLNKVRKLIDLKEDGSFRLRMKYFAFPTRQKMWSKVFEEVFGMPRQRDGKLLQGHKDIAASIQRLTEEVYFKMANYLQEITGEERLCVGGGVGLNALANGGLLEKTGFQQVTIFGPAGDGGAALGAASYACQAIDGLLVKTNNLYLGSHYEGEAIEKVLKRRGLKYRRESSKQELVKRVAKLIAEGKLVGWFQGRMEYGPRALGSRSILAKPGPRSMKDSVNVVKRREDFRPFAASVMEEHARKMFVIPGESVYYPAMNFCFQVRKSWKRKVAALVHADGSCRIQTVNKRENGLYYDLIREFYELTGVPCVLNTSFNVGSEPIVELPEQAVDDFLANDIDYLAIGNYLVRKPKGRKAIYPGGIGAGYRQ